MVRKLVNKPFVRPISYPSPSKVEIDMDEVISGHQVGGSRLAPDNKKSLFPANWTAERIEVAIREAYRTADTLLVRQGNRLYLEGAASGWRIRFWYHKKDKRIETAFPNRADVSGSE